MLHKIKDLCVKEGITIAELERQADLARSTVARWDETMPAADKLARVARVLHTTVEDLLADPEEPAQEAV